MNCQRFVCLRHQGHLTLSVDGCARMWKRAQKVKQQVDPDTYAMLKPCRQCELGARHAEMEVETRGVMKVDRICSRCHRPAYRFIYGRICVSCYNREREVMIGANRRGHKPLNHPAITVHLVGVVAGTKAAIRSVRATSHLESLIAAVKQTKKRVILVRPIEASRRAECT